MTAFQKRKSRSKESFSKGADGKLDNSIELRKRNSSCKKGKLEQNSSRI
jgi:hypothetical protein